MNEVTEMNPGVSLERHVDGKKVTWLVSADSVLSLTELAEKPYSGNRSKWSEIAHRNTSPFGSNLKWFGVNGGASENQSIIKAGEWAHGVQRMEKAMADMDTPTPISVRRSTHWTDQGDELEIHRVYNGQLGAAWRRSGPRRRQGNRSVTIMVNLSINAGVYSEVLFWKGAAAMKLADVLTAAGYSVEIIAAFTTTGIDRNYRGENACLTTVVKSSRAPLDLNALAVTTCLAGFFRHVMFKALLAIPTEINSGLGHSEPYRNVVSEEMDSRQMLLCESMNNAAQANAWVAEQIAKLEGGVDEVA